MNTTLMWQYKTNTKGKITNFQDEFNLLCINEKDEPYYGYFISLISLTIASEYTCNKEFEL